MYFDFYQFTFSLLSVVSLQTTKDPLHVIPHSEKEIFWTK